MCNDYIVIYTLRLHSFTPTHLLIYLTHHHPRTLLFFIYQACWVFISLAESWWYLITSQIWEPDTDSNTHAHDGGSWGSYISIIIIYHQLLVQLSSPFLYPPSFTSPHTPHHPSPHHTFLPSIHISSFLPCFLCFYILDTRSVPIVWVILSRSWVWWARASTPSESPCRASVPCWNKSYPMHTTSYSKWPSQRDKPFCQCRWVICQSNHTYIYTLATLHTHI